jgi:hypothetical protein
LPTRTSGTNSETSRSMSRASIAKGSKRTRADGISSRCDHAIVLRSMPSHSGGSHLRSYQLVSARRMLLPDRSASCCWCATSAPPPSPCQIECVPR